MGRFLFRLIPWWIYAIAAITLAPLAVEEFDAYQQARWDQTDALIDGPPPAAKVTAFSPGLDAGPLDEVVVTGSLRADLGILDLTGDGVDYRAVVMGEPTGPIIAILMTAAESDRLLTEIVGAADGAGRVTVRGFLTDLKRNDILFELDRSGLRGRAVHIVRPYTGDRAAALQGQVQDVLFGLLLLAGFTLLFALIAAWRFRQWRKRRAARRNPGIRQARPSRRPARDAATFADPSPWEAAATTPVPLDAPPELPVEGDETLARALDVRPPEGVPEFQSVFPGGGSGFRFKTADEIIRQSFGTLTALAPTKRQD